MSEQRVIAIGSAVARGENGEPSGIFLIETAEKYEDWNRREYLQLNKRGASGVEFTLCTVLCLLLAWANQIRKCRRRRSWMMMCCAVSLVNPRR
jgi:hypothetical protein